MILTWGEGLCWVTRDADNIWQRPRGIFTRRSFRKVVRISIGVQGRGFGSGSGGWWGVVSGNEEKGARGGEGGGWVGDRQRNRQVNAQACVKLPFRKLPSPKGETKFKTTGMRYIWKCRCFWLHYPLGRLHNSRNSKVIDKCKCNILYFMQKQFKYVSGNNYEV